MEVSEDRRQYVFEDRWNKGGVPFIAAFEDLNFNREANETAAKFVRNKIKSLVKDSNVAKLLTPNYPIGCKRLAVDSNYYETYNRSNISLIDLKTDPLKEFTKDGISTSKKSFELDVVILATGFDAMTGTLFNIDIEGKDNIKLKDKWSNGPKNYLGLSSSGSPNLPRGISLIRYSALTPSFFSVISVLMNPGATALIVISLLPTSLASDLVKASTPALAAA